MTSGASGRVEVGGTRPGHPPLAAWTPSGPPSLAQALTVLGWRLQGCGAGLCHGEERIRDVGQEAIEIQKLAPTRLLLWAPQQHGHHAGEELLAPSLRRLPPPFRLGRQSRQQLQETPPPPHSFPAWRPRALPLPPALPGRPLPGGRGWSAV